ncbi:common plant regulatory factor 1-like isoform X4 [Durio zibethinus]|uniref:Common plant regulatory factor 1-like isoform X4 n=1 Tax=Durio zibethinus TaxID=66656 RepID=A0A6P5ZYB8_DURZI|nr:common plant regulatory factor 1-like isoform X4 [Durio zibethinus]
MGNNDEGKSSKSDKSSSLAPTDQTNIHVYPDWAAMQAYYGPRVTMPPYYNSAVASGHAPPPYMWGPPQPMIPPYGAPYAAIYSHGGVYAHPAVPLTIIMQATAPVETPTKSSGNTERGLVKKLKLAMSIVNGTAENAEGGPEPRLSQSVGTEGSTDGSDSNTTGTDQSRWKRSREGTPTIAGGDGKNEAKSNAVVVGEVTATVSPKPLGTVLSPGMTTALELRNPSTINAKSSPTSLPCGVMPSEVWLQAETEELARKVESLTAENAALRSEINQLSEKSEKLRLENATLVEGLKSGKLGHAQEIIMNKKEDQEGEMYEKKSNSGAKLHQLLDASPRAADAVAAG